MKRLWIGFTAMLLIGLLAACSEDESETNQEEADASVPVETVEAAEDDLVVEHSVFGRTAPSSTSPLMLQASGEIDSLEVENGEQVEEDEAIATILTQAGTQEITAPRSGEITNLQAVEGDMLTGEEPLAVIADMNPLLINFSVTAETRELLSAGDELTVIIEEQEFQAEITSVGKIPGETALYPVEATVENEDEELIPGLVAELIVPETRVESAVIVPTEAVIQEAGESFVFVLNEETAERTAVTVQETQSEETAIEEGLQAGDVVVVNGQNQLEDGDTAEVVEGE
ncbi:efflux RND transporter periplasmic adaptor subunit [Lentibacillus sediminis]|uniref:efflux RND transporter periplasmic adaptor subunit n=1 Tax=Lentibacillus sediminis TaxID=1940529 RepID=UPI000C1BDB5F|nr:efflux RND transporter periplasmic adaptor subunit [Lentibacillus sediminis]